MRRLLNYVLVFGITAIFAACQPAPTPPSLSAPSVVDAPSLSEVDVDDGASEISEISEIPKIPEIGEVAGVPVSPPAPKPSVNPDLVIKPLGDDDVPTGNVMGDDVELSEVPDSTDKPFTEQNADDVINNIIWKIQSEVARKPKPAENVIPEGQDPSLARDALEAAFALLAQKAKPLDAPVDDVVVREWSPEKAEGVTRVALLLPLTGPYRHMGDELRRGAELALFSAQNPMIELMVYDTIGGQRARRAAEEAVAAQSDIIIGPLFSNAVSAARGVADQAGIPMLLLSNNALVAASGSWLMGYLPEQQLDLLLGHAVADGRKNFAIIAEDTAFGKRLAAHASRRLDQLGLTAKDSIVLREEALAKEDLVKRAIKRFARYQPPAEDELATVKEPVFDALIFAGGAEFALRTAPVLAYYDLGSDAVMYLGNAQWNQNRILSEPSLQGGLFAFRPSGTDVKFVEKWNGVWSDQPGLLARLSFDAMALAEVLSGKDKAGWQNELLSNVGFNGFSGAFRFLPGGANVRAFELRQIIAGKSQLLQPAPDKI